MDSSKHIEFARILGLSPGLGEPSSEELSTDDMGEVKKLFDSIEPGELDIFWSRVAADYLPSLTETFRALSIDWVSELWKTRFALHSRCFQLAGFTPYGPRFVRHQKEEAVAVLQYLLNCIYGVPDSIFEDNTFDSHLLLHGTVLTAVRAFTHLMDYPVQTLPIQVPSPIQRSILRKAIQTLVQSSYLDKSAAHTWLSLESLVDIISSINPVFARYDGYNIWWSCEWGRFEREKNGESSVKCVEFAKGEEMQACSRCLTVRYCSREHQKLHWKEHKPHCFKPSW